MAVRSHCTAFVSPFSIAMRTSGSSSEAAYTLAAIRLVLRDPNAQNYFP